MKAWLREGKTVELRERERVLARIVPAGNVGEPKQLPDFEARTKKAFGDRIFPNLVIEERKRARY